MPLGPLWAVVWWTAVHQVVALELLATGQWQGEGALGREASDAVPFLHLLTDHGSPAVARGRLTGTLRPDQPHLLQASIPR